VSPRLARLGGSAVGLLAWLLLGGWFGAVAGLVTAVVAARFLRRVESRGRRRDRERVIADLPFAADLLAAALRAGTPTDHGLRVVGTAVGGALGRQFVRVADGLRLGLQPADAWATLRTSAESGRFADAVSRTADSGAAVARALDRLADALRTAGAARVESAAQRLSVLMVLPLGLCFLPAFVFAGIAPVIVAVLGGVLR
jgi:pilus assembly protein TadC